MKSNILKIALFATGLAGIVAEYILSTLATYFLGDSVFQWTMIVSIMLFSMGLGSRLSKSVKTSLLVKFIIIEFGLSLLTSFSSLLAYTAAAYTIYTGFIIYSLSITIGLMIGMERPLVIRLNNKFEELRINVSSVMEKDYYGSLAGGLFFAFVGLPYLGLTYTPFILGSINFIVALLLLTMLWKHLHTRVKYLLGSLSVFIIILITAGIIFAKPVILFGEQKKYKDKIVFSKQTRYQRIVVTQWKENYWLYINGNLQLSSLDEKMYHEPLVHPAMEYHPYPRNILILGGGDGCAAREVLKHKSVENITLVDIDPVITALAKSHKIFRNLNNNALNNQKVSIVNADAYYFMQNHDDFYDVIIIDLPDPRTIEIGRLYSQEFYEICRKHLRPQGILVTQAGSPYYAAKAFLCIKKTLQKAGFTVVPYHNQILTMGEWGWMLGTKQKKSYLKKDLGQLKFENISTSWLNNEAMLMMTSFGKEFFLDPQDTVEINKTHHPVLYRYYLKGSWDLY